MARPEYRHYGQEKLYCYLDEGLLYQNRRSSITEISVSFPGGETGSPADMRYPHAFGFTCNAYNINDLLKV